VDPKREPWWYADYKDADQQPLVTIRGVKTAECPTSLISPFSKMVIQIKNRARQANGDNPFGDLLGWPAKLVDAFSLLGLEERATDDEIREARRRREECRER
jgi:hypothetical protein